MAEHTNLKSGYGYGKTVISYSDMNLLRSKMFDVTKYANIMRGNKGMEARFRNILPPTVKDNVSITGCGKLPDPSCLTSYEFSAKIDKNRIIDEISDPCDWALIGQLGTEYATEGTLAWSRAEAKGIFNYVSTKLQETTKTGTDVKVLIEDMVLELEDLLYEQMGDLAPTRETFIVTVNSKLASDLKKANFNCCDVGMVTRDALSNDFDVASVDKLPNGINPAGVEVMVYVPYFVFELTMCEQGLEHSLINQTGYKPNTNRWFAFEEYGFDTFHYVDDTNAVVPVIFGVKKSAVVTP